MANWLNIAGGAAQGYVQGDEDNRRRREFETLQRQRLRVEKKQKEEDELDTELGKVRPAGTYTDTTVEAPNAPLHESGLGVDPGKATTKETKVTAADADRARADVIARKGGVQRLAQAAQLRQGAFATEAAERSESRAKTEDVFLQAGQMKALGNHIGAMRHLAQAYDKVPDGHKLQITEVDGVPHVGVVGPSGQYIEKPVPITGEVVDRMINRGIQMTSVQAQQKGQELGIHQQTADAQKIQAEAANMNAETARKKAEWETIGAGGDAELAKKKGELAYMAAHAEYYKAAAVHQRQSGNAAKFGQSMPFSDGKGGTVYMTPIRDPNTGKITWQRDDMPEGLTPFTKPRELNDAQKVMMTAELADHKLKVEGLGTPSGYKSRPEADAAWAAIQKKYNVGGGDDFITKANAANPALQPKGVPTAPAMGISPLAASFVPKSDEINKVMAPRVAVPSESAEDTKKYTRKQIRGGYEYTAANRGSGPGKTRAQWAAEDAAK